MTQRRIRARIRQKTTIRAMMEKGRMIKRRMIRIAIEAGARGREAEAETRTGIARLAEAETEVKIAKAAGVEIVEEIEKVAGAGTREGTGNAAVAAIRIGRRAAG